MGKETDVSYLFFFLFLMGVKPALPNQIASKATQPSTLLIPLQNNRNPHALLTSWYSPFTGFFFCALGKTHANLQKYSTACSQLPALLVGVCAGCSREPEDSGFDGGTLGAQWPATQGTLDQGKSALMTAAELRSLKNHPDRVSGYSWSLSCQR